MTHEDIQSPRARRKPLGKRARFNVLRRDGFRCVYCGSGPQGSKLHLDHLVPLSSEGPNHPCNLVTSCQDCNLGKGSSHVLDVRGEGIGFVAVALMEHHSGSLMDRRYVEWVSDLFACEPEEILMDQIIAGRTIPEMVRGMMRASGYPE